MASASKAMDQGRATVFAEGYCAHADLAYRYCYVLLLNGPSAKQVVQTAFREIAKELSASLPNADSLNTVLAKCWKVAGALKPSKPSSGDHPLMNLFGSMPIEDRSILFLMDVAGRSISEAATIAEVSEDKVRKSIANGRRSLLQHEFSKIQLPEAPVEELESEP